jgi:S-adenosylmethionine:tRNA ribosyltransferase-isomerase
MIMLDLQQPVMLSSKSHLAAIQFPKPRLTDFELPSELEATAPPEARGLARDKVRLMVSYRSDNHLEHARFDEIGKFLEPGDVLVINTSGTMPAAMKASSAAGLPLELHLSTRLPADLWVIELRRIERKKSEPFFDAQVGEVIQLPEGASAKLLTAYTDNGLTSSNKTRLWIARLQLPSPLPEYLARNGFPIRYNYVNQTWPIEYYQTVYTSEVGSAEMPSAGRPFTPELITELVSKGVQIAPMMLHTGVASQEAHEPPYEEYYQVPAMTASIINNVKFAGKRTIAVGTTVVRALESVSDSRGHVHPGEGWTGLVITPSRGIRVVDGLLTGFHQPQASHLSMLAALAGHKHISIAYHEALTSRYLWHEFGDIHLILP